MIALAENLALLDAEVREAYELAPTITLNKETYLAVRAGGGVSAPVPIPESIELVDIDDAGVEGKLYRPKGSAKETPCLIYFHGGGYVFGKPELHAGLYLQYVQQLGIAVFAVLYRRAPEHAYPAQLVDGLRAWDWTISGQGARKYGFAPACVALGGTSAGGGLAAGLAVQLRDLRSSPEPAGLVLNIPWLSKPPAVRSDEEPSWHDIKFDKIWSLANCNFCAEHFLPAGTDDPRHYAYAADAKSLTSLPPTIVSVAEQDILRDSGINFARRVMKESANGCELHVYRGAWHGSSGAAPKAATSIAQDSQQVRFVRKVFNI